MYGRFLGIVAASRHKTPQQVDQIAQGRVWDGGTAHQIGLVDGFGGIERCDRQGGAARQPRQRARRALPRAAPSFRDQLIEAFADSNDDDTAAPTDAFSMLARAAAAAARAACSREVSSIMAGPSIQARCLECPAVAPARLEQKDLTLLGLIG